MIRVGITHGDINGIGIELILKIFKEHSINELFTPVIFSSQKTISFYRKALEMDEVNFNTIRDLNAIAHGKTNLFNCYEEEAPIEIGKATDAGGKYAFKSLESACQALQQGKIDVLVTAPINKHNIQSQNFPFKGHTEYLDEKFGKGQSLMLLVSDELRVGLVTGHVPISEIKSNINTEKIIQKLKILEASLSKDFGIRKPKIAVLGLNPHAGDSGTIGSEEKEIIKPAINNCFEKGMLVYGPYPADGFFGSGNYKQFDGILAMYHDQGLIPFKMNSFSSGVNYTAGLPIVRTSPDHGTAYDIAGKKQADEESFRQAIYLACDIFRKRKMQVELSKNPLRSAPVSKE